MAGKAKCADCGRMVNVNKSGSLRKHECKVIEPVVKGPWFGALYDGICSGCNRGIYEGDRIRANGSGGYECEAWCGQDDPADEPKHWDRPTAASVKLPTAAPQPAPTAVDDGICPGCNQGIYEEERGYECDAWCGCGQDEPKHLDRPTAASVKLPTAAPQPAPTAVDEFLSGTEPEPQKTISGQPEPKRDNYGRYLMKDPRTGQYKTGYRGKPEGFTRATTFNKTLSDTYALSQWGKRNVLVGASKRADLVAQAFGQDVRKDKAHLDVLVAQATEAAGDKIAANLGTAVHRMTEMLDSGLITLDQVPPAQRADVQAYHDRIRSAGMSFRREWIERSTMTSKFGEDVAGTFDRIGTLADGSNLIVDLKTGRDPMTYGSGEISIQMLTYALGVNEFGIYDWNLDEWVEGPRVREDVALVIHLPVQRDDGRPAYCDLHWVNLADPDVMEAARQSAFARRWRKKKGLSKLYRPGDPAPAGSSGSWESRFSSVTTKEAAGDLYKAARGAVEPMELKRLVGLAQDSLRRLGVR